MNRLTHIDESGAARMVDISEKPATQREATAEAIISLSDEAYDAVIGGASKKGDVLAAVRIAGIMAAKRTSELIPLCHPVALSSVKVDFEFDAPRHAIRVVASANTTGQTGVEMEALTAVGIAALTIYDMTKALNKAAVIDSMRLLSKSGGKSGEFQAAGSRTGETVNRSAAIPSKAKPSTLMSATSNLQTKTSAAGQREIGAQREAFRAFMTSRRLRATQWAKDADVPVAQIYAFLTGKTRSIPTHIAERLARAARSRVEDLFQ